MCLGIPGRIVDVRDDGGMAMGVVDFGGVRRDVCLAYLDEPRVGEYAIVHVGFALTKVDEEEARKTFEVLREMSELDELEWIREVADRSLDAAAGAPVPSGSGVYPGAGEPPDPGAPPPDAGEAGDAGSRP